MIRTLIIDDEPAIRKDIECLLQQQEGFILLGSCGSIEEARVLIKATKPQLLLLDIELKDGTAFDLLREIGKVGFDIIFITAYNDYALKAIKAGAIDYLVKPLDETEFGTALEKIRRKENHNINPQLSIVQEQLLSVPVRSRIALKSLNYLQIVDFVEINYCVGDGGYTTFHLTDKRKIMVSRSLKDYEELLPAGMFLRTHQSYMINQMYVDRFHKDGYIVMKSGAEIPVATRKKESVLKILTRE